MAELPTFPFVMASSPRGIQTPQRLPFSSRPDFYLEPDSNDAYVGDILSSGPLSASDSTLSVHSLQKSPSSSRSQLPRNVSRLSLRNSSIWMASASMDMEQLCRSNSGSTPLPQLHTHQPVLRSVGEEPRLDKLPIEILTTILQYIACDSNGPQNLYGVLSTCGRLYDIGVAALYRHVIFRYPQTFDKFRWSIESNGYGQLVRVLDFSAFTSVGLGRTRRMNMEIEMVTENTIVRMLELCPGLNEFLVAESVDIDLGPLVFDKLLTMPMLNTVDLCGATAQRFIQGLEGSLVVSPAFPLYNLTKVSLHCCSTVPATILGQFLSKLVNVTRLDLTNTLVNDAAMMALPESAKLTHLSLSRCLRLTSEMHVKIITSHPATRKLVWLSLMYEGTKPNPLSENDIDKIMRNLPRTLRHLNVNGLNVTEQQLYMTPYETLSSLSIRYADISIEALIRFLPLCTKLKYIDLASVPCITSWTIQNLQLLNANPNIDMFEVRLDILQSLRKIKIAEFVIDADRGRRSWIHRVKREVREDAPDNSIQPQPSFSFAQHAIERMNRQAAAKRANTPRNQQDLRPSAADSIWRFASHKVNLSEIGVGGVPTPAIYGREGIYNYYSLNNI